MGLFAVAVIGLGSKYIFDHYLIDYRNTHLRASQAELMEQLEGLNNRLAAHQGHLDELYEKNNRLYSPIVGESQISGEQWQGGAGGTDLYAKANQDPVAMAEVRMERLAYQQKLLATSLKKVHFKSDRQDFELKNMPSIVPADANLISGFGNRVHPVTGGVKFHAGLDFACGIGTPIYATGDGVVESSGYSEHGYGINVNIDHQNGYKTKYAHLSKALVEDGQHVKRGQLIAYSGNTGLSSGPHLHYEIMHNGEKIDPVDFFYEDLTPEQYRAWVTDGKPLAKEALKEQLSKAAPMD